MSATPASADSTLSRRKFLAPLALAQFICSFAGSNMNVMINDITEDLDTTVQGVQAAITLFLLIMAILMIPCSKLTDRWGRKRCFTAGLVLYGIGALLSAVSPGLGVADPGQLGVRGRRHGPADSTGRVSFVVAVFLQEVRGYNAIETGVIFTAATVGVLVSSLAAERLAKRRPQKTLIIAGFVVTIAGIGLLLALVGASSRVAAFGPGLLLIGLGLGVMLTPSVNVVQSSFPEQQQGEISGLSRSVSNLGSSFGTAIAGTIGTQPGPWRTTRAGTTSRGPPGAGLARRRAGALSLLPGRF